jgi:hypothetical protein
LASKLEHLHPLNLDYKFKCNMQALLVLPPMFLRI